MATCQVHEMAAILNDILNFSQFSRVTKVHPADFEIGLSALPKKLEKLTKTFPGSVKMSHLPAGLRLHYTPVEPKCMFKINPGSTYHTCRLNAERQILCIRTDFL